MFVKFLLTQLGQNSKLCKYIISLKGHVLPRNTMFVKYDNALTERKFVILLPCVGAPVTGLHYKQFTLGRWKLLKKFHIHIFHILWCGLFLLYLFLSALCSEFSPYFQSRYRKRLNRYREWWQTVFWRIFYGRRKRISVRVAWWSDNRRSTTIFYILTISSHIFTVFYKRIM